MNNLQIQFDELAIVINVTIRILTALIFLKYLIPLFIKEAGVKNGLKILRYELLFTGLIIFGVNTSGLLIILLRYMGADIRLATDVVTYINTFGFLGYALLKWKIYTQKYSIESKLLHEKIDKLENRELKRLRKKTKRDHGN